MSQESLHKAMRKYGNHRFSIQEIDECDESLLNEKEQYWIQHYNTIEQGYNNISSVVMPTQVVPKEVIPEVKELPIIKKVKIEPWGALTDENRGNGKHCGLKIRGKNLETGLCTDYENARMAALSLTNDPNKNGNILLAARKGGTAYGHKWQILEDKPKKKSVFAVNKKTGQIQDRYESIADAVRTLSGSGRGTGLVKSLRNPGKYSWYGSYWFYG